MEIKKIRKNGLMVIVGATLIVLLGISVSGNYNSRLIDIVLTVAVVALIAWFAVMAIIPRVCRRH